MADYDLLLLDTKAEIIRFNDAPAIVFQILCWNLFAKIQ